MTTSHQPPHQAPRILVVDDQPINVKLLDHKLCRAGMTVITANSGREALELAQKDPPDVILLDVMMPGMDGLETCRHLKENEATRDIPILFITAKTSREGKIEGLDAGAADYITKPIDLEETLARINTQLRILDSHRRNLDLQRRLAEARQNAAMGYVTQGIAHNLNNMLGVVIGYLDLLKAFPNDEKRVTRSADLIDQAVKRIVRIVQQLTTIATQEELPMLKVSVESATQAAIRRFREDYQVDPPVELDNDVGDFEIETNIETFEDSLGRLLINAYESYPEGVAPTDRTIHVSIKSNGDPDFPKLTINVRDQGEGIDPSVRDHMFEPFVTKFTNVGKGMGLTIARHSIRNLGGEIDVADHPEGGVNATVSLPLN